MWSKIRRALRAHSPKPCNVTGTQLLRTVRAHGRQCGPVGGHQGNEEVVPSNSPGTGLCASHCARIVIAPSGGNKRVCREEPLEDPPPQAPHIPPRTHRDGSGEKEAPRRPAAAPGARGG